MSNAVPEKKCSHPSGSGCRRRTIPAGNEECRPAALDDATGETEWTVDLAEGDARMTPPPAFGYLDGDGEAFVMFGDGVVVSLDAPPGE